jgi:hypothetical protein
VYPRLHKERNRRFYRLNNVESALAYLCLCDNHSKNYSEYYKVCMQNTLYTRKREKVAMNIRSEVSNQFEEVARDDLALADSGLDSICLARIVVGLELELELDPFSAPEDAHFPITYGEFVQCYENAAKAARIAVPGF